MNVRKKTASGPNSSLNLPLSREEEILPDGRVRWKVKANKILRKKTPTDKDGYIRLLYNEYPDPKPVNIKTGKDNMLKGLPEEQAQEAYEAACADPNFKSLFEEFYKAGLVPGFRAITSVETKDQKWPATDI
ncbi:MAG: hypothetical protein KAS57_06605 [Gammaproteobacteria bacterium]|nr:hypothetical protein [Gammaproteobacteria bacterium]